MTLGSALLRALPRVLTFLFELFVLQRRPQSTSHSRSSGKWCVPSKGLRRFLPVFDLAFLLRRCAFFSRASVLRGVECLVFLLFVQRSTVGADSFFLSTAMLRCHIQESGASTTHSLYRARALSAIAALRCSSLKYFFGRPIRYSSVCGALNLECRCEVKKSV